MKTLLIIISSILAFNLFANELKWVDEQIQAIKPARSGISKAQINAVKSPFVRLTQNKAKISSSTNKQSTSSKSTIVKKRSKTLVLEAIINNSARINGKWYITNDKIGKYTLNTIDRKSVTLSYKKKKLILSTFSKNKNLNFKSN